MRLHSPTLLGETAPNLPDWGESLVHRPVQITLQMFNGIRVWTVAGPFQSLSLTLVKPLFCWFRCVFWVIAVLKNEVPLYFQLSNRKLKVLCQQWLVFGTVYSPLPPAPVPAELKLPQGIMLPPPCFTVGMVSFSRCALLFLWQIHLLELCPVSSRFDQTRTFFWGSFQMSLSLIKPHLGVFLWKMRLPSCHPNHKVQTNKEDVRLSSHVLHSQYLLEIPAALSVSFCWPLGSLPD